MNDRHWKVADFRQKSHFSKKLYVIKTIKETYNLTVFLDLIPQSFNL